MRSNCQSMPRPGVSGGAAGLIRAKARDPELGFVGDVTAVNPNIIEKLLAEDLIPVISTIGEDDSGQAYNINADTVAAAIAESLHAEKLVYLTDFTRCGLNAFSHTEHFVAEASFSVKHCGHFIDPPSGQWVQE